VWVGGSADLLLLLARKVRHFSRYSCSSSCNTRRRVPTSTTASSPSAIAFLIVDFSTLATRAAASIECANFSGVADVDLRRMAASRLAGASSCRGALLGYLALGVEEGENDAQKKSLAKKRSGRFPYGFARDFTDQLYREAGGLAGEVRTPRNGPAERVAGSPFARRRLAFYLFPKLLARHIADLSNDRYCLRVS
jgi:hypothetical protein